MKCSALAVTPTEQLLFATPGRGGRLGENPLHSVVALYSRTFLTLERFLTHFVWVHSIHNEFIVSRILVCRPNYFLMTPAAASAGCRWWGRTSLKRSSYGGVF